MMENLEARVKNVEERIARVEERQLEMKVTMEHRLSTLEVNQVQIKTDLSENTKITKEIHSGVKGFVFVGKIATTLTAVLVAIKAGAFDWLRPHN